MFEQDSEYASAPLGWLGIVRRSLGVTFDIIPAGIYLLKINNRNARTRCEICSKLTIKTPERRQASFWCRYC